MSGPVVRVNSMMSAHMDTDMIQSYNSSQKGYYCSSSDLKQLFLHWGFCVQITFSIIVFA